MVFCHNQLCDVFENLCHGGRGGRGGGGGGGLKQFIPDLLMSCPADVLVNNWSGSNGRRNERDPDEV